MKLAFCIKSPSYLIEKGSPVKWVVLIILLGVVIVVIVVIICTADLPNVEKSVREKIYETTCLDERNLATPSPSSFPSSFLLEFLVY